jgi:cytochrome c-type biogenesis protein CcmF
MIVHLGVIVIAVAFAASQAYGARTEVRMRPGQVANVLGHSFRYEGRDVVRHANRTSVEAKVRIDGAKVYRPAISNFPFATQAIGTPSVRTGLREDVYLTLVVAPQSDDDVAVVGVNVQPLVVWLWIGTGLMALGTAMAALPGRRRRPTSPVSAPVGVSEDEAVPEPIGVGGGR